MPEFELGFVPNGRTYLLKDTPVFFSFRYCRFCKIIIIKYTQSKRGFTMPSESYAPLMAL